VKKYEGPMIKRKSERENKENINLSTKSSEKSAISKMEMKT
jgi:hypothetical protein